MRYDGRPINLSNSQPAERMPSSREVVLDVKGIAAAKKASSIGSPRVPLPGHCVWLIACGYGTVISGAVKEFVWTTSVDPTFSGQLARSF